MAVPAIALYAGAHAPHHISPYDLDAPASASPSQRHAAGGLSCLFSTASYSTGVEDLGLLWHDRAEELGSFLRCSSLSPPYKRDQPHHQSPVSVLHSSSIGNSRSPSFRLGCDFGSIRGGFARHALGSCLDYDSTPLTLDHSDFDSSSSSSSSTASSTDELTFNMEDNSVGFDLPPYARDLLSDAQSRHSIFRNEMVIEAFYEAEKAHRGQMRASGHPYLQHCVETAALLAKIGANSTVVAVGLLHDTMDDSSVTYDNISRSFGSEVADLVQGVSKLSELSKLARQNNTACKTAEADRLHTMFLAMDDARAVLIKLADRLHNMLTLDVLPLVKRQRIAKETLEIFAPLANRLGIYAWKEQLENLCFKQLNPDRYRELSSKLVKTFDEAVISSSLSKLELALKAEGISFHSLSGRHKSLYSIHTKMLKKKLTMDEIHDIHGLRLIVETEEDCYEALRVVRQLWHEVPGKFKDYIRYPKFNGYQSLHMVVTDGGTVPIEVQIRTKEMHLLAEYGFAAHWRYKEGDCVHSSFVLQMVEWARWVITWQCEAMSLDSVKPPCTFPTHSNDCAFSCKPRCSSDGPIFVILIENDKMSVREFPANSSVKDVVEIASRGGSCVMSSYGFPIKEELRPRLNHKPVSDPTCKLKMGDVVELTPTISDKSLIEYREEIQRMYDRGLRIPGPGPLPASFLAKSRS